jgi:hypothetical protein
LIVGPFGPIDQAAVAVSNSPDEATDNDVLEDNRNPVVVHEATADDELEDNKKLVIRQAPDDFYYEAHPLPTFLKSSRALESAQPIEWPPIRDWSNVQRTLLLLIVAVMSVAIFIGFVWRYDNSRPPRSEGAVQTLPSPKTQNEQTSRTQTSIRPDTGSISGMPDFELPTVFGVYAVNDGKLFQLDTLPIRVPDQRVAISAMISKPSPTTIPSGKIAFVVFRRDLVSSAPDKVLIRVVARVARELQFPGNGPATIVKIDDQWAVRSNAYEFAVAPLNDNPQMIVIHAARPDFSLPVGRYALVLKEQAFDFTVGGQITDAAQCLERTDAVGGAVYSECRQIP